MKELNEFLELKDWIPPEEPEDSEVPDVNMTYIKVDEDPISRLLLGHFRKKLPL